MSRVLRSLIYSRRQPLWERAVKRLPEFHVVYYFPKQFGEIRMSMTRRDVLRCSAGSAAPVLMPGLILGAGEKDAVVKTTAGMVRGRVENGIFVYRGVPYGMDT